MSHCDTLASEAILLEPPLAINISTLSRLHNLIFSTIECDIETKETSLHVAPQQATHVSAGSMLVHAAVGSMQLCQSRTGAQCT
jgi:hypothetical protein